MATLNEKIVPVDIEEEMRGSYIDYSMSVIVARALPDVRDGLKPVHRRVLFGMQELGLASNRAYKKSRPYRRRGARQVPSPRRLRRVRHDGAHGAGFLHALSARGRPGELRLGGRRLCRGHAVHRSAHVPARGRDAARSREGHGQLRAELRRHAQGAVGAPGDGAEPSGQRRQRHRGRHGDEHPAAQSLRGHRRLHRDDQGSRTSTTRS